MGTLSAGERGTPGDVRWFASTRCPACGSRSEMDGPGPLPEDLRSPSPHAAEVDPDSPLATARTIRNCTVRMRRVCPMTWDALQQTPDPAVRHCRECARDVFFCSSDAETIAHVRAGHCIAREEPHSSELPSLVVGQGELVPHHTDRQRRALALTQREQGINRVINGRMTGDTRDCPQCGFPVQTFRKTCYVCGADVGRA